MSLYELTNKKKIERLLKVENEIINEIRERGYTSFTEKECSIMYNSINFKTRITPDEFQKVLAVFVEKGKLFCKTADSGMIYYELNKRLKEKLNIN